ncbi:MAG TPA: glucose-6-phosphate dehydrogenase [Rhizomicrobium sp.]
MNPGSADSKRAPPPPLAMVIFGANGDLTKRLVVPALYNLAKSGLLPEHFAIVGLDHNEKTGEQWSADLHDFLEQTIQTGGGEFGAGAIETSPWQKLASAMSYVTADFGDANAFKRLAAHLADRDGKEQLGGNILFYLAVPDRFFGPIVDSLGTAGLLQDKAGFRRVVIEKPFGHDLESAKSLNARIHRQLREDQIYRIDHFLGKETVQNILALRFANGLFEPVWNRDRIDHVQITVAETIGIEERGSFYEQTGALRDMVPNHLFQLVAMTAMEPPASFDADDIRARKADVFKAVHPVKPEDAVRGQYAAGRIGDHDVAAYRKEDHVATDSFVETFVALKLCIDNWRWAGVPFYLRTGKRLPRRTTEIAIRFKEAPFMLFKDTPVDELGANWLVLQIQPDEGIRLRFNAKIPGPDVALESVAMDFRYTDWFKQSSEVGYETLLYDCFMGDPTLFQRADQVEAAWAVVEPLLDAWRGKPSDAFPNYAAGSAGPQAADALLTHDGRAWRAIR